MSAPTSGKQDFTPVAVNQIQREKIKKEMRHHALNKNFHANPVTLNVITPKPNERGKFFLNKDQVLLDSIRKRNAAKNSSAAAASSSSGNQQQQQQDSALMQNEAMQQLVQNEAKEQESRQRNEAFRSKLKETQKMPKERFRKPITSNHKYGWFHDPLYQSKRFYQPKNRCAETVFADALVRSSTMGDEGAAKKK